MKDINTSNSGITLEALRRAESIDEDITTTSKSIEFLTKNEVNQIVFVDDKQNQNNYYLHNTKYFNELIAVIVEVLDLQNKRKVRKLKEIVRGEIPTRKTKTKNKLGFEINKNETIKK